MRCLALDRAISVLVSGSCLEPCLCLSVVSVIAPDTYRPCCAGAADSSSALRSVSVSQTSSIMSDGHSETEKHSQPSAVPAPSPTAAQQTRGRSLGGRVRRVKRKLTTRHGWLGDYDYAWLCMPALPRMKTRRAPPFYALDAELPILVAATCGLQHALAMLAGLITPPIIFASTLSLDDATQAYMISASLIGCGE